MSEMNRPKVVIDKIKFNDGQEISFSPFDIVVFVGPNNAGKSQVLRDIDVAFNDGETTKIVAESINLSPVGDGAYFTEHLVEKKWAFFLWEYFF